jgi:RNA polymerase sigma-70 factor (ECF subfamily)
MWSPLQSDPPGRAEALVPGTERELPQTLDTLVQDPVAFRHWYDLVLPRVYRYLLARAGDEWLAEELTQQTFVEAIRNRRSFDGRSDVVTWLCAIGRHKLVDHYRRSGREATRQERLRVVGDPPDHARSFDERDAIRRALDQMPDDQRLALILRYLDQMSVRDVAGELGRSEKATESLLSRARESFRQAYGGPIHD